MLSRIANFDDFDALRAEPQVELVFTQPGSALPADAGLIILPGTKSTLADLAFLRAQGWDIDILAHARRGGRVLGVCGGYQMLGRRIADPQGSEGAPGDAAGLGLLDIETVLDGDKVLRPVTGRLADTQASFDGYEIHIGRTTWPGAARPFAQIDGYGPDGAVSADGRVAGAYIHGLFNAASARAALLKPLGVQTEALDHNIRVESALDAIAAHLHSHLDIAALAKIAGLNP
jgi:adenosylcobyric acid synthase